MSPHTSTAGQLLVATPLTGDFFRRSVVLVLHHDEEGAHGLVLNSPTEAEVAAVLPEWQPHVTAPGMLFQGGPVGMDTAMGLVSVPGDATDDLLGVSLLFGGLGLVDLDAPPPVVTPEIAGLRIFVGYAGWSPGQLDQELRDGAWYVVACEPRDPFQPDTSGLWRDILVRQRDTLSLVATHTDTPELN
ncbi:YqgE/AlgH family protein [Ornithinicoccus hortensis]|uniref:Putative transcriptional regulator n=1 Tax=Ornithinicoccus hortensis TaxID=82346 RepID=A0A542YRL9_9MICO|nr:YqgE/AlgH family protein [Ornithinicoccus hortensis]TQL50697.1 putative transcriptional regulator [Ornithinicoccus hortensis]